MHYLVQIQCYVQLGISVFSTYSPFSYIPFTLPEFLYWLKMQFPQTIAMQFQLFHFMPPATSEKLFRSCGKITGKTRLSASYSKAYIWWASFRFTPSSVKSCISIVLCSFLVSCLVSHNFELFPMASISPSCFCCCSYTTFDLKILIVQIKLLNMLNQLK